VGEGIRSGKGIVCLWTSMFARPPQFGNAHSLLTPCPDTLYDLKDQEFSSAFPYPVYQGSRYIDHESVVAVRLTKLWTTFQRKALPNRRRTENTDK